MKVTNYRNLIMSIIFLVLGIICLVVSIIALFVSLKWGLIILVISIIFFGFSWFGKVGANSAKKAGKQTREHLESL